MNIKKELTFELTVGSNIYRLSIPEGAPLGELYDVTFQMQKLAGGYCANAAVRAEQSYKESMPQESKGD